MISFGLFYFTIFAQKVDMFTHWIKQASPLRFYPLIPYFWESDFFSERLVDEAVTCLRSGLKVIVSLEHSVEIS